MKKTALLLAIMVGASLGVEIAEASNQKPSRVKKVKRSSRGNPKRVQRSRVSKAMIPQQQQSVPAGTYVQACSGYIKNQDGTWDCITVLEDKWQCCEYLQLSGTINENNCEPVGENGQCPHNYIHVGEEE